MAKLTLSDLSSGYGVPALYNANNAALIAALENTLSRDGSAPNEMAYPLDMGGYRIINAQDAVASSDLMTLGQAASVLAVDQVLLTQDNVAAVLLPEHPLETLASVTPVNLEHPYGDIRRYGGVGNGVADDTTPVLNMLKVAEKGLAGIVPDGYSFLCSTWVARTTTAAVKLRGGGTLVNDGTDGFLNPQYTVDLADVKFNTWLNVLKNARTDSGTVTQLKVRDCEFTNVTNAIDLERPLNKARIRGNTFISCKNYNIRIGWDDYASEDNWTNLNISDNHFDTITSSGTASATAIILYGIRAKVSGNIINSVDASAGSGEAAGIYTKVRFGKIYGNSVTTLIGAGGSATIVGINVKGSSRGVTSTPQGFNTLVYGNSVYGTKYGIRAQCDNISIFGNVVEEADTYAYALDAVGDNFVCANNRAYIATEGSSVGVLVTNNGSIANVTGNTLKGFNECIRVAAGAGETNAGTLVTQNICIPGATGDGIKFGPNATGTITNTIVRGNKVTAGLRGITMPSTGTVTGMVVEDNDLRGATTKISGSIPSGSRIQLNQGWVTEAFGVTAAIATGATVTHGLNGTPTVVHITSLESVPTDIYVTAIGATTFAINFGGGGSRTFAWSARLATTYA